MQEYEIHEPKKGLKKAAALVAALILVLALVAVVYYLTKVNRAATSESHELQFTVAKGLSTRQIASALSDKKIINNKLIFIIYADLHHAGDKIQAGDYKLNSNMTIVELVNVLTRGRVVESARSLTVIEGWTNKQLGKFLSDRGVVASATEFDQVLAKNNFNFKFSADAKKFSYQGFLFPDTYKLSASSTAPDLVAKMLKNFENKITDRMITDTIDQNLTLSEAVTVASIVEKEVGRNKENLTADDIAKMQTERKLVASVFYNRLKIGMALESDATVNYITGKTTRSVSIDDTKIKSPYNTYMNRGLPPSPISNPGLDSIKAAIYPAQSDYLYFLNKPDGEAVFARTLDEHNANKAKYLK
jgi:UPF0755 protein